MYGGKTGNYAMFSNNYSAEEKRNALAHQKILDSLEFIYALTTPAFSSVFEGTCGIVTSSKPGYCFWPFSS